MNELQVTFDGRSYTFQPGQTVYIGRLSDNSIVVGDPTVSRRHAQLTWGPVGWLFENLGQARTFHNGQEIRQVIVRKPTELSLAAPQGPVLHLEPLEPAGSQATFQAGPQAAPFYAWVRAQTGWEPRWNFNKVLIGRDGGIAATFASGDEPQGATVAAAITAALQA